MVYYDNDKPYTVEVHIADIHFGAIEPRKQYNILCEQFLDRIALIPFDILSIDGDIFDKKFMANSEAVYFAMAFVDKCVDLCKQKNATIILIYGTESHDAGQFQLFRRYLADMSVDMRIIDQTSIIRAKGLDILCIPEEYDKGAEYYRFFLDTPVDTVFMHGTVVGSVYGANKEDLNSKRYPVFSIDSFNSCRGPIIAGHVHKAMCLNSYIYYCSNPIRYRFGEEEDKGYCIVCHDRVNGMHTFNFMPIESFRYDTIDISTLEWNDPNLVINYLNNLLVNGIDHIRVDFSRLDEPTVQQVLEKYYATNPNVVIKRYAQKSPIVNTAEEIEAKYSDLDFLLDPKMDSYTKFVEFINHNEGTQFISVEKLKTILSGGI